MQPRAYQSEAVAAIWSYFQNNKSGNPLIAMPTGTGKSVVIADFARSVFQRTDGQRILVITHVKELVAQNFKCFRQLCPEYRMRVGVWSAGLGLKYPGQIVFGGIASVHKRSAAAWGKVNLVIVDEAHLVSPKQSTMYQRLIDALREVNPALRVIGFTATPYRLGQGLLTDPGGIFTDVAYDLTRRDEFNRLIHEGWVCPLIPMKTDTEIDVRGVSVRGGEFVSKALYERVGDTAATTRVVDDALRMVAGRRHRWLVFAAGIEHSEQVATLLRDRGVSAAAVHGGNAKYPMESQARDKAIAAFNEGRLTALVNNNILTTGYDNPQIDCIICLRPTMSPGLWVQMLGRGTRIAEGKENCLVLDYAGNTARLGPINDPVKPRRKSGKGGGDAPIKLCPAETSEGLCNAWNHTAARYCISCGYEFPIMRTVESEASQHDIIATEKYEALEVDDTAYGVHCKKGRPDSLRVTYKAGLNRFDEWVCLEHSGYARYKAHKWWQARSDTHVPETAMAAYQQAGLLRKPVGVVVEVGGKYNRVIETLFDERALAAAQDRYSAE